MNSVVLGPQRLVKSRYRSSSVESTSFFHKAPPRRRKMCPARAAGVLSGIIAWPRTSPVRYQSCNTASMSGAVAATSRTSTILPTNHRAGSPCRRRWQSSARRECESPRQATSSSLGTAKQPSRHWRLGHSTPHLSACRQKGGGETTRGSACRTGRYSISPCPPAVFVKSRPPGMTHHG